MVLQLRPLASDTPHGQFFTGWPVAGPLLQKCMEAAERSPLGLRPVLPTMTLSSFILLVQVSAKGTQMERENSGLGLDRGKNSQNVNIFILEKT